ncbi:cytochrome c oxidase subunit 2A [Pseudoneobacillus sp. C159]
MAKAELNTKKKIKVKDAEGNLTGTLASVFLLGFFIIVTWVGVWLLFLDRF